MTAPLLVRAAKCEPVERTPVWFMRQAGRSLPEYRALRERHDFFELGRRPELCAEVTLQPVRRHGVDAAVMFADIMTPVAAMGVDVKLVEGVGPVIDSFDARQLHVPDEIAPELYEAIRIVRSELDEEQAVVGFCGAPFTVAGYLVEGKPSRDFAKVKALMYREPCEWHELMGTLADAFARYVREQVDGLDWRIPLDEGWELAGERGVQGNLDPAALLAPWDRLEAAALDVLERARGRNGHIFNLGHGILPQTDPDAVTRLTELVQARTVEARV